MATEKRKVAEALPAAMLPGAPQRWHLNTVLIWLFGIYLLMIPAADTALHYSSRLAAGNELTRDRSRFSVVNAATLTGFQGGMSIETYPLPGKVTLLLLTFAGSSFAMIAGGLAVVRIVRLPYSDRQIVYGSLVVQGTLVAAGTIVFIGEQRSPMEALMLAASAFGNSGMYLGPLPGLMAWQTWLVLMPLAVIGGLGLPVLFELADALHGRKRLSYYARTVLWLTAAVYLVGLAALLAARWAGATGGPQGIEFLASSSAAAVNSRTLGLPFEYAQEYPRTMQWVVVVLMIIGGSTAGTAGGLKMTTLAVLGRGVRRALGGATPGRAFGIACVWVAAYFTLAATLFITLVLTAPQIPADRLMFESISALSNVGLSYDRIFIVTPGLDALTAGMLLGRLAPLAVLWWMAQSTQDADLPVG